MQNQEWPKIRQRRTKVKGKSYFYHVVDLGVVDGKRVTKNFKPDEKGDFSKEGKKWVEKKRRERNKIGKDALLLSDKDKQDAVKAVATLKGIASLKEAADFYIQHNSSKAIQRTVKEIIDEYLQEAEDDNLRPESIKSLRYRLSRLDDAFGATVISQVSKLDVTQWLRSKHTARKDGKPSSSLSRRHYETVAGGLFNFAIERGYIVSNPFASNSKRRKRHGGLVDEKMPEVITASEVEKLLYTAQEHVPDVAPALAIGFFSGLRTSELKQLKWQDIDLDAKIITVSPRIAKKRYVRHVDIQENLLVWLSTYSKSSGLVAPGSGVWRHRVDKVKELSQIEKWPRNVMRHCFATFHLAMFQDQNKTALQLGHRDTDLLYRHYRNLATAQDSKKYWSIFPKTGASQCRLCTNAS